MYIYGYFSTFHNIFPAIEHSGEIANHALILIVPFALKLHYCCIYALTIFKYNLNINTLGFALQGVGGGWPPPLIYYWYAIPLVLAFVENTITGNRP